MGIVKRIIITPYKMGSRGAKSLQRELNTVTGIKTLRVNKHSPTYRNRNTHFHINWGVLTGCAWANTNQLEAKRTASNKLKTFRAFSTHGVRCPDWTTDKDVAIAWCMDGHEVVARTTLTGHSGQGIVLCKDLVNTPDFPTAPLYVKYKKKKHEFRVHVFNGQVIDVTQKKKRTGFEGRNHQIRNHQNGWVYCRDGVTEPTDIRELAINACQALNLQYGAVDIIWNEKENTSYVLEINTAPGLEGQTIAKYVAQFTQELANHV